MSAILKKLEDAQSQQQTEGSGSDGPRIELVRPEPASPEQSAEAPPEPENLRLLLAPEPQPEGEIASVIDMPVETMAPQPVAPIELPARRPPAARAWLLLLAIVVSATVATTILIQRHREAEARARAKQAVKEPERPPTPAERFQTAIGYLQKEQPELAVGAFETLNSEFPNQVGILLALAQTYQKKGDFPKAEQALLNANRIDPDNAVILNNLGIYFARTGQPAKAVHYVKRSIEKDPKHPELLLNLGRAYELLSDWANAVKAYQAYLVADGRDPKWIEAISKRIGKISPLIAVPQAESGHPGSEKATDESIRIEKEDGPDGEQDPSQEQEEQG